MKILHGKAAYLETFASAIVCALACSAFFPLSAYSQTASEIVPESFRPEPQRLTGSIDFSGEPGLEAPPGAEDLTITLAGVEIEGALPAMAAANMGTVARLTRGTILVSEIFEAASDLEASYAEAGFVLARVVLPAQSLVNGGTLRLEVVDGFIESIDASAAPPLVRARIQRITDSLVGARRLTLSEIERQLLLAGDTYGVALGSALSAGATPGGTVLVLEPDYRPVTGFIGFDNTVSDGLGGFTIDGGVEFNGLLGFGEAFYARASIYPGPSDLDELFGDEARLRTLAGGAVFPVGDDGLTFNVEGTHSRATPKSAVAPTTSKFERLSFRLNYPWVRSRDLNLSSQVTFDMQSDSEDLLSGAGDIPVYRDDLRVLRFASDLFWPGEEGEALELGASASFGLDALGARSAANASGGVPLSRSGADADFVSLELSGRYRRSITERAAISISARGQTSLGDPLVTSEQIGIATSQEISPFDAGSLSGDSGWVVRGELSSPIETEFAGRPVLVSPYAFTGVGAVYLEQPSVLESAEVGVSAFGVGLDINALGERKFRSSSLRIEYGKGYRDDDRPDSSRLSIITSVRF